MLFAEPLPWALGFDMMAYASIVVCAGNAKGGFLLLLQWTRLGKSSNRNGDGRRNDLVWRGERTVDGQLYAIR
jgi:hypothetical protein